MRAFNYNEAKAGAPVCTRDGRKARIVCWDVEGRQNYPILALVLEDGCEGPCSYTKNGRYWNTGDESEYDLMMVEDYQVKTIIERVKLENNVGDIFRLPCVESVQKYGGKFLVYFKLEKNNEAIFTAKEGDTLIRYDDDTWDVMRAIKEEEQNG